MVNADTTAVELSAGTVAYQDTGGDGPVVVLLHGLLMDGSLWSDVVTGLRTDHRCITPTLPLGAHLDPMHSDADLSLPGLAELVIELLAHLHLDRVVLVGNDTGGAVAQLVAAGDSTRLGALVLVSCEAFDNIPPGLTGRTLALVGKLPPRLYRLAMTPLRLRPLRRLPVTFGWMTRRGDPTTAGWVPAITRPRTATDAVRCVRAIVADPTVLLRAVERLRAFDRPALVIWARRDRVMPLDHGRRLAALLPNARLVEVDDSYTLIPLDQPGALVDAVRGFTRQL